MYLDKVRRLVIDSGCVNERDIVPCNEAEIVLLELEMNVAFPASYREFLLWCGKKLGNLLWADRYFFPEHIPMKEEAIEMLEFDQARLGLESDQATIDLVKFIKDANTVVISTHEGACYTFIRADEGDDPPVYHLFPPEPAKLSFPSFSEYLYREVNASIDYFNWKKDYRRKYGKK